MTRYNVARGRRSWWLRQLNPDTGEGSYAGVISTMLRYCGPRERLALWAKVADGLDWQGAFDEAAVSSLGELRALKTVCEQHGIAFCPVIVPRSGVDPAAQAAMHGQIAQACGCACFDIEPYQGFYPDTATLPAYCAALRQQAGDAYLIVQPDPREVAVAALGLDQIAFLFDAICAQHYVGWASIGWLDLAAEVARFQQMAAYGKDTYVTLYGVERTDLAAAFWSRVRDMGAQGYNVFSFGPMGGDELSRFGGLVDPLPDPLTGPDGPQPDPQPDPVPPPAGPLNAEWQGRTTAAKLLADAVYYLTDQDTPLAGAAGYMSNAITGASTALGVKGE